MPSSLSKRAIGVSSHAHDWRVIWDAGPYFARMAQLWEQARSSIVVVGWQLDSRLQFPTGTVGGWETLRAKVLRLCEAKPDLHFYFLVWDHAWIYVPQREWLQTRVWEELHPRVHLVFDNRHPFGASHHEKLILVDGVQAMTGSVDLCADRWDSPAHLLHDRSRSLDHQSEVHGPYHELGLEVSGAICGELTRHIAARWERLSSIPFPKPAEFLPKPAAWRVHLSRTFSGLEKPLIREVEHLFTDLISKARERIWMEGQYFWSPQVQRALHKKMSAHVREGKGTLAIHLILADDSQLRGLSFAMRGYQGWLVEELRALARAHPGRLEFKALSPFTGSRSIYVHSKILVIDDRWLAIGSANFAERALRLDSEHMLTIEGDSPKQRARIRDLHDQLRSHWSCLRESTSSVPIGSETTPVLHLNRLIDPSLPFFYKYKRRFVGARHTRLAAYALAWLLGFLPVLWLSLKLAPKSGDALIFSAALYSVWLIEVPFTLLFAFAPGTTPTVLVLGSFWMATLTSALWGRVFPGLQRQFCEKREIRFLPRFGARTFASLLLGWADPRASVHQKMTSQSHYSVPWAWIILANGLILSGVLAVAGRVLERCWGIQCWGIQCWGIQWWGN